MGLTPLLLLAECLVVLAREEDGDCVSLVILPDDSCPRARGGWSHRASRHSRPAWLSSRTGRIAAAGVAGAAESLVVLAHGKVGTTDH
ncbi:MAG: hypothetical protein IJJ26_12245 [Victivallales bacterium]|nr:hypothetical protein [Victivallales bacterium]